MKKFFTLCLSILMGGFSVNALAATDYDDLIQFTDSEGNVYENGSTVTGNQIHVIDYGMGEEYIEKQVGAGVCVMNTSDAIAGLVLKCDVKSTTNGTMQVCFPSQCVSINSSSYTTGFGAIYPNSPQDIQLHLLVADKNALATAEVEVQVIRYDVDMSKGFPQQGDNSYPGSKITIKLTTDQTAGIQDVTVAGNSKEVARYTLDGRKLSAPQKGINIVKYADGRTVKVLEN